MIRLDSDGVRISNNATAQDVLTLAQAIREAREIRLRNGYTIGDKIIDSMVHAMEEAVDSYRKSIKED